MTDKKRAARPAKKVAPVRAKKSRSSSPKKSAAAPAAPLLARSPKKVGEVAAGKHKKAPGADASYQPKTEAPPPAGHNSRKAMPVTQPAPLPAMAGPLTIAAPWIRLGLHMARANFALQSRIARAALESPAAASRQGSVAFGAWLSMISPRKQEKS